MSYVIVACLLGVFGGFGSVSRGRIFQRTTGHVVLGTCFIVEIGLSVAAGMSLGLWLGICTFLLAWIVCGHIGAFIYRLTP